MSGVILQLINSHFGVGSLGHGYFKHENIESITVSAKQTCRNFNLIIMGLLGINIGYY